MYIYFYYYVVDSSTRKYYNTDTIATIIKDSNCLR